LSYNIQMVDLKSQYQKLKPEIDVALEEIMATAQFIKGPVVKQFEANLQTYLNVNHVIGCANGTDALQIALMALDLEPGDEVIVPSFTYVATAEVIALLRLKPIMIDVDPDTFNIKIDDVIKATSIKTKVIIPVHLFGQSTDMEPILQFAKERGLYVIEDNAQAIGSNYRYPDGRLVKTGTMADIGTTSFFPSKNLGCYGDGGAIFCKDDALGQKIRMLANHGQSKRYYHDLIGCNSRLDSMQAAILDIKLKYLDEYAQARQNVAKKYNEAFEQMKMIQTPRLEKKADHVYHQYTLRIKDGRRDELVTHLKSKGIPTGIYYPVPLYKQKAFMGFVDGELNLPVTEMLCKQVISLPIHTEMTDEIQNYIIEQLIRFFQYT